MKTLKIKTHELFGKDKRTRTNRGRVLQKYIKENRSLILFTVDSFKCDKLNASIISNALNNLKNIKPNKIVEVDESNDIFKYISEIINNKEYAPAVIINEQIMKNFYNTGIMELHLDKKSKILFLLYEENNIFHIYIPAPLLSIDAYWKDDTEFSEELNKTTLDKEALDLSKETFNNSFEEMVKEKIDRADTFNTCMPGNNTKVAVLLNAPHIASVPRYLIKEYKAFIKDNDAHNAQELFALIINNMQDILKNTIKEHSVLDINKLISIVGATLLRKFSEINKNDIDSNAINVQNLILKYLDNNECLTAICKNGKFYKYNVLINNNDNTPFIYLDETPLDVIYWRNILYAENDIYLSNLCKVNMVPPMFSNVHYILN